MFWISTLLLSAAVEGAITLRANKCNPGEFNTPKCHCNPAGIDGIANCYGQLCCETCPRPLAAGKTWKVFDGPYPTIPQNGGGELAHWDIVMQDMSCKQLTDGVSLPSMCLIGTPAYAQVGLQTEDPITGAVSSSDGCCLGTSIAAKRGEESWCQSTGDPHLVQFNHGTGDAYVNGDYWLYKGEKLQVAVRHVKDRWGTTTRAGNNAFYLNGELLGGHKLEYYDLDTQTRQSYKGRTEAKIYIDGQPITAANGLTAEQNACKFYMDRQLICACEWSEAAPGKTALMMRINDETSFQVERWDANRGWNDIYLNVNELDKKSTDKGMCTYEGARTDPHATPYHSDRIACSEDIFTDISGKNDADTEVADYFCRPETDQRRRWAEEKRRRSEVDDMNQCKTDQPEVFQEAYLACSACTSLGQERLIVCITDACFAGSVEGAQGEVLGCVQQLIAFTPPADRPALCPGESEYSPLLQTCVQKYTTKPSYMCTSPQGTRTYSATILADCREKCSHDLTCNAYDFDAYKHQCRTFTGCLATSKQGGQYHYYSKVNTIANRGGAPAPRGSGLGVPLALPTAPLDTSRIHNNVDRLHGNVEGVKDDLDDHIDDVHDNIDGVKGEIDGVRDEVRSLSATMEQLLRQISSGSPRGDYRGDVPNHQVPGASMAAPAPPAPAASPKSDDTWKVLTIVSSVMLLLVLCCCGAGVLFFLFKRM